MIMSEKTYREYPHHLENPENIKLIKRYRNLTKLEKKLLKKMKLKHWISRFTK